MDIGRRKSVKSPGPGVSQNDCCYRILNGIEKRNFCNEAKRFDGFRCALPILRAIQKKLDAGSVIPDLIRDRHDVVGIFNAEAIFPKGLL
jgi:hypothetical protein